MSRLSVDIGGTFTDVVLEHGDSLTSTKTLTTPEAPDVGAMRGIDSLLDRAGAALADIDTLVHGTTLATNALIERRGARTALVTTAGFRDVLGMAHEKRFDQYDVSLRLPEPLVPRERRHAVDERIDAAGRVLLAPDPAAIEQLAATLVADEIEAVAIGFLHAYANPAHERLVADRLRRHLDESVTLCLSAEVSPEIREYERFSTVCANAYVRPLMSRYLTRFERALRDGGFGGECMLMLSGGGLTTLAQACLTPIRLLESGPAGGVAFAAHVARDIGSARTLSFDMGGTTAKVAFLENAEPDTERRFEVARAWRDRKGSGLPVRIPTIELVEIGAGGGSIARRDAIGRLAVGPRSAGSVPGPAAYDAGGTEATISDADVVLGKLSADGFADGAFTLRPALASEAVRRNVAEPLGFGSVEWAAHGIAEIGEEAMANAARVHALERGKDVTGHDLVASGGAAPLHAVRVAEKLGIRRVVIPHGAGVGSAIGFLSAAVAYEVARSVLEPLATLDLDRHRALVDAMREEALDVVLPALAGVAPTVVLHAELRHTGQGHTLRVALDTALRTATDIDALATRFLDRYDAIHGVMMADNPIELVSLALSARGPTPSLPDAFTRAVDEGAIASGRTSAPVAAAAAAFVFDATIGQASSCPVFRRDALPATARPGTPCLVREAQTTTHVPPGWSCEVHAAGHLVLTRTMSTAVSGEALG